MTNISRQCAKHVPQRTCVVCRRIRPKRELVRVVRTPSGSIEVDVTGKKAGRGAYLCPVPSCWEAGLSKNRLNHALKVQTKSEDRQALLEYSKTLPTAGGAEAEYSEEAL